MHEGAQREYFRARFLADVRANHPAFFVDAIGEGDFIHRDLAREGHESFPELADYIRREYVQINGTEPIRVYVNRAREGIAR